MNISKSTLVVLITGLTVGTGVLLVAATRNGDLLKTQIVEQADSGEEQEQQAEGEEAEATEAEAQPAGTEGPPYAVIMQEGPPWPVPARTCRCECWQRSETTITSTGNRLCIRPPSALPYTNLHACGLADQHVNIPWPSGSLQECQEQGTHYKLLPPGGVGPPQPVLGSVCQGYLGGEENFRSGTLEGCTIVDPPHTVSPN